MKAKEGEQCTISNTVKSYQIQAKCALKLRATGWVWFNYEDKQKGHFKCKFNLRFLLARPDVRTGAVNMNSVLYDDRRTSEMGVAGDVRPETQSAFAGKYT